MGGCGSRSDEVKLAMKQDGMDKVRATAALNESQKYIGKFSKKYKDQFQEFLEDKQDKKYKYIDEK